MMKKMLSLVLILMLSLSAVAFAAPSAKPEAIPVEVTLTGDCIVGHSGTVAAILPEGLKLTWKSSSSKIASVNNKGVVKFKKPGEVIISVTGKSTGKEKAEYAGSVTLNVVANENSTENCRVYLKGNFVYADIKVANGTDKPLKKLGKTMIAVSGIEGFSEFEAKKGTAKKAVKPGESGMFTFKLMKVKKAEINLTAATASIAA